MYTKHAELKAGILVLVALGVLGFFIYRAGGSKLPWAEGEKIHLRFEQGFAAPSRGDPVVMNGLRIGTVVAVGQGTEVRGEPGADGKTIPLSDADRARMKLRPGEPGVAREVFVTAVVELARADQVIPKGTRGQITVNLTGARELALLPGLSKEDLRPADTEKEPIRTSAAGDIADIQRSLERVADKIGTVADNANLVLADVRAAIADIRKKIDVIDLASIQANVLDASIKTMAADASLGVKDVVADLKELLGHLKTASAEVEAIVARASPKVDEVLDQVLAASRSAASSVKEFEGLGTRVQGVVGSVGDDLDRILARVAEGAHNLADVLEDLRAHPWKLANKPEDKEIAFENVRNAASSYVRAARSLEESLRVVKELEARKDLPAADRDALLKKAWARLQGDLAAYDEKAKFFSTALQGSGVAAPR